MQYNFNITDNDDIKYQEEFENNYKKYDIINKYKIFIFFASSFLLYFIFKYIGTHTYISFFMGMNNIIRVIISCCISGIVLSCYDYFYDAETIYRRMLKKIEYAIIIKNIETFADVYDIDNIHKILPGLKINYSSRKICQNKFALLFELGDNKYEIVDFLKNDKIEMAAEYRISANDIFNSINKVNKECVDKDGYVKLNIVKLKKDFEKYAIITNDDFFDDIIVSEFLLFPYILEKNKDEKIENTNCEIKKED